MICSAAAAQTTGGNIIAQVHRPTTASDSNPNVTFQPPTTPSTTSLSPPNPASCQLRSTSSTSKLQFKPSNTTTSNRPWSAASAINRTNSYPSTTTTPATTTTTQAAGEKMNPAIASLAARDYTGNSSQVEQEVLDGTTTTGVGDKIPFSPTESSSSSSSSSSSASIASPIFSNTRGSGSRSSGSISGGIGIMRANLGFEFGGVHDGGSNAPGDGDGGGAGGTGGTGGAQDFQSPATSIGASPEMSRKFGLGGSGSGYSGGRPSVEEVRMDDEDDDADQTDAGNTSVPNRTTNTIVGPSTCTPASTGEENENEASDSRSGFRDRKEPKSARGEGTRGRDVGENESEGTVEGHEVSDSIDRDGQDMGARCSNLSENQVAGTGEVGVKGGERADGGPSDDRDGDRDGEGDGGGDRGRRNDGGANESYGASMMNWHYVRTPGWNAANHGPSDNPNSTPNPNQNTSTPTLPINSASSSNQERNGGGGHRRNLSDTQQQEIDSARAALSNPQPASSSASFAVDVAAGSGSSDRQRSTDGGSGGGGDGRGDGRRKRNVEGSITSRSRRKRRTRSSVASTSSQPEQVPQPQQQQPYQPHIDLASYPPTELLRLIAQLLGKIAQANDALRPVGGDNEEEMYGAAAGFSRSTGLERTGSHYFSAHTSQVGTPSLSFASPGAGGPSSGTMRGSRSTGLGQTDSFQSEASVSTSGSMLGEGNGVHSSSDTQGTSVYGGEGGAGGGGGDGMEEDEAESGQVQRKRRVTAGSNFSQSSQQYGRSSGTLSRPPSTNFSNQPYRPSISHHPSASNSPTPGGGGHHHQSNFLTASLTALLTPSSTLCFHARNIPSISIESYLLRILKYCPTTNDVFLSLLVYFDRMARIGIEARSSSSSSYGGSLPASPNPGAGGFGGDGRISSGVGVGMGMGMGASPSAAVGGQGQQVGSGGRTTRAFAIDSYNVHRLVIAGVTVASKFFSDVFYTNSRYAKASLFSFAFSRLGPVAWSDSVFVVLQVGGLPLHELNQLELQFLLLNDFRLVIPVEEMQRYADQLLVHWVNGSSGAGTPSVPPTPNAPPPTPAATAASTSTGTAAARGDVIQKDDDAGEDGEDEESDYDEETDEEDDTMVDDSHAAQDPPHSSSSSSGIRMTAEQLHHRYPSHSSESASATSSTVTPGTSSYGSEGTERDVGEEEDAEMEMD